MAARSTNTPARKTVAKKSASVKPVVKKRAVSRKSGEVIDVQVQSYIPDISVFNKYVPRKVWGVQDKMMADIAMRDGINILLQGETGSGKTLFGEAYASHEGFPYYSLPCDVSIDPSSLFGKMMPTEIAGKFEFVYGPISNLVRTGGVLNISEINFMTPKIAASLYPLLDGRRYIPLLGHEGEVLRAHRGGGKGNCWCSLRGSECDKKRLLIIADMNPNYRGTMELNAAFKNRFEFKVPWNYDSDVEEQLVKFPTLRAIAKRLREMTTEIQTPVSTNMLMEYESFALNEELSFEFAKMNFASAFHPKEQEPVTRVFELNEAKLRSDMAHFIRESKRRGRKQTDDDLEEVEFEQEQE